MLDKQKKHTIVALLHATCVRIQSANFIRLGDRTGNAPYFSYLEYSHALVDVFHLLSRVRYTSGAFSTPYTQEENNPGSEGRELRGQG